MSSVLETPGAAPVRVLLAAEYALAPAIEADWLGRLPPARRAELLRWPDPRDRHRSLLGTRLLRAGLRRLGHPAAALAGLRHPPRSAPTLDLPLRFSVSHCAGLVACAVSADAAVGIDVEALGTLTAAEFRLYLSAAERGWAGADARRFYAVWTRKEAVAKAAGASGLAALRAVDTSPGRGRATFAGRVWRTTALAVGRHHVAQLASPEGAGRPRVRCERLPRCVLEGEDGDGGG